VDIDKNIEKVEAVDPAAYGGSRYRLSYDKYQGAVEKARSKRTEIVAVLVVAVVFFVLGFLIYRYFDRSVRHFFNDNSYSTNTASANFQSYHGVETDMDS